MVEKIYISGALRVGSALTVVIFFYVECSLMADMYVSVIIIFCLPSRVIDHWFAL